jgi:hypothetical protein
LCCYGKEGGSHLQSGGPSSGEYKRETPSTCAALAKREDPIYRVVDPHQGKYKRETPSTCAALAKREDLIYRVVDAHQVNTRDQLPSTCAALAKREDLIYRVVDPHQVNMYTREKLPPLVLLWLRGRISSSGWWTLIR